MKQKRGITLILLIVTIIVLLILAGVAINTLIGNNGTIQYANKSVEKNNNMVEHEQELLDNVSNTINNYMPNKKYKVLINKDENVKSFSISINGQEKEEYTANCNIELAENSSILISGIADDGYVISNGIGTYIISENTEIQIVTVKNQPMDWDVAGNYKFEAPYTGIYKLEVWGAQRWRCICL